MFSAIIKDAESGYMGFINSIDELVVHIDLGINMILLVR